MDERHEHRWTPERLRNLRLGGPDPALREQTLGPVRQALSPVSSPAPSWAAEMALAAALTVFVAVLPHLAGFAGDRSSEAVSVARPEERLVAELGLGGDIPVALRLHGIRRQPSESKGRFHIHGYREP